MQKPCCRWRKETGQEFGYMSHQKGKVGSLQLPRSWREKETYARGHEAKGGRMMEAQMFIER